MIDFNNVTVAKYKKLTTEEQDKILSDLIELYIKQNLSREEILKNYNIGLYFFKWLLKEHNIKKDKSLVQQNINSTFLTKYGHTGFVNREKIKETNLQRYGVDNPSKAKEIIEKRKITNQKLYGGNAPIYDKKVKEKIKQTNLKKYGVENVFQSKNIQNKISQTKLSLYGDSKFVNKDKIKNTWQQKSIKELNSIKEKRENTNLKKFGVKNPYQNKQLMQKVYKVKFGTDHPWKNSEIREKISKTIQEKYGVPYYCMTDDCKNAQGHIISKINLRFADLLYQNNISFEQEFILENRSYDFKINDNILLEINPTYTHNSIVGPWINGKQLKAKDPNYHLEKTQLANKYNFRCIHVWDSDDWNKVINLFTPKERIYARLCEIKEVSLKECNEFLNDYHLQNTCKGQSIRLGLYYNNTLIEIMTFGKPRYNKNYEYELLRLCSHKDYIITGGSQKLWNYFLRIYSPSNIISYCDNSKFSGRVYDTLGMEFKYLSQPVGNWYFEDNVILDSLLRQRGFDQLFNTHYGKNTSNEQLMIEHNWLKVYNCGQKVFTYN